MWSHTGALCRSVQALGFELFPFLPATTTKHRYVMEQQNQSYSIKVILESTGNDTVIRKLTFNGRPSWEELSRLVIVRFQLNTEAGVVLKYLDQEQDMIAVVRLLTLLGSFFGGS